MGAAGPSSRRVVRKGKAMIHSSRRDRKAEAIAEVLAMIANAQASLAPHRPRPVLEADERLFETAAEFCAALEKYAEFGIVLPRKLQTQFRDEIYQSKRFSSERDAGVLAYIGNILFRLRHSKAKRGAAWQRQDAIIATGGRFSAFSWCD
jgi:hypothetical protein